MGAVRYGVALVLVVVLPPLLLFWLLVHPFIRFWRRLGVGWTYGIVGGLIAVGAAGLVRIRTVLLATQFGTSYPLMALGIACFAVGSWLGLLVWRQLPIRVLLGVPELAPDRHPTRLVTEGLYARVRHPRYLQFLLSLFGCAFFANYLTLYLAVALWVPGIYLIAFLEERELRDRFGPAYDAYCRRVPRFIPNLRRAA